MQNANNIRSPFHPIPASKQHFYPLPHSRSTCRLSVMSVGKLSFPGKLFVQDFEGDMHFRDWAFLIEGSNGELVVWDLGLRKDLAYSEETKKVISTLSAISPTSSIDILRANKFDVSAINTVMLSHMHFDHVGDFSTFPDATELYLGPFDELERPSLVDIARSLQVDKETLSEHVVEFMSDAPTEKWSEIGCFRGIDFWGDGSLYIISTPGHKAGHMSALIRTHSSPDVFHLLAGDAAHSISLIDPTNPAPIGTYRKGENPLNLNLSEEEYNKVESVEDDLESSYDTMSRMARMDDEPNIVVWLAHDATLAEFVGDDGAMKTLDGGLDELQALKRRDKSP